MRDGFAKTLYRHLSFEERPGENPWLDLLRCAAIGLVLARHGHRGWIEANGIAPQWGDHVLRLPRLWSDHVLQWSDYVLLNGWIGVDLFLVLSGYLIARILIRYDPASLPRRSSSAWGSRCWRPEVSCGQVRVSRDGCSAAR